MLLGMEIAYFAATDVGRARDHNEDYCLVDPDIGLFVMCDGMGGHAAGEVASKLATETIQNVVKEHADGLDLPETEEARGRAIASLMRAAIEDANRAVHKLSRSAATHGAGTTCTSLLMRNGKASLGHVGDSRAYLFREGHLHQISDDHTFAAEAVRKGVLSAEEVAEIPEAAYLTRAVGPHPSVLVDTLVFDILPGDTILLCSDGLHGYFESDEEAIAILQEPVDQIADKLIAFANERGGEDNITAVVLHASADDLGEVDERRMSRVNANFSALRHIDLFGELTMAELAQVNDVLRSADYDEGATILLQGEDSESLFVIVEGTASVHRDAETIATLSAGSHFGEMALLTHRPRTATVKAVKPCRLLVLEREAFYGLAQQDPVIGVKFLWKLAQTLSTRLNESFLPALPADDGNHTVRYGMFPSPFSQR